MTGYYIRAMVDGRPRPLELEDLDDDALKAWALTLDLHAARAWAVAGFQWIRDNVRERPLPRPAEGAEAPPSFTCPDCGRTSHNPNDALHRYCGACHRFFA